MKVYRDCYRLNYPHEVCVECVDATNCYSLFVKECYDGIRNDEEDAKWIK